MANTFGQSKANETNAGQNNKELNGAENSPVTDEAVEDRDKAWRPTDSPAESVTDSEFDEAEVKNRNKQIKTDSPGVTPDIAE
jgi:hypothetical protein